MADRRSTWGWGGQRSSGKISLCVFSVFFMIWLVFYPRLSTRRFGSGGSNSQLSWEKVDESQMRFELPAGTLIYAEQVNEVGEKPVSFGISPH